MKNKWLKKLAALTAVTVMAGSLAACGSGNTTSENTGSQDNAAAPVTDDAENSESTDDGAGNVPDVVNIGVQTLITPELIARYDKVYEEYLGTKVNLVQFDSGADVNKAFASGSIDIAAFGSSPASIGIAQDLGYEVFWYYDVIGTAESLAANPDAGISSLQDLAGKKVATPFASTAHYSLLNALKLEDVDVSEIELLDMQPDDINAAWQRKDIDAAYVWNPVLGNLLNDGAVTLTDSAQLAEKGIVTADVAAVRKAFAEEYPDVVVNYVKAQIAALDEFENNNESAVEKIASAAGIEVSDAAKQVLTFAYPSAETQITADYLGTSAQVGALAQTLKNTADFLVEQGSLSSAPDLSVFEAGVTGEFVEKALAQ